MSIVEVANRAGVSKSVAADILREDTKYTYKPDTVERVRAVAREMGYRTNTSASLMRSKRTHQIGIFTANLGGSCTAMVSEALVRHIKASPPFKPVFIDPAAIREKGAGAPGFDLLEGLFWSLPYQHDGILQSILAAPGPRPRLVTLRPKINPALPLSSVVVNIGEGSFQATEYLIKLGHSRIAVIYRAPRRGNERFEGYKKALKAHGLPLDPSLCHAMPDDYTAGSYFVAGRNLTTLAMSNGPAPTAILCHNDEVAIGALRAAHELGLNVPRDLSIVGFDGVPLADFTVPSLTTVVQPIEDQVSAGVRLMLSGLNSNDRDLVETAQVSCTLRLGESTAPPRSTTWLEIPHK